MTPARIAELRVHADKQGPDLSVVHELLNEIERLAMELRCAQIQVEDRGHSYDRLRKLLAEACEIGNASGLDNDNIAERRERWSRLTAIAKEAANV